MTRFHVANAAEIDRSAQPSDVERSRTSRNAAMASTAAEDGYNVAEDFEALAKACPALDKFLIGPVGGPRRINFRDESAVEELTRSLLQRDYGVSWERPPGALIPPVPNRMSYVAWLRDLIAVSPRPSAAAPPRGTDAPRIRGVDVGTGGSLIYALLGAASCGWSMIATDVTDASLAWAERNRASNPHLAALIEIRDARPAERGDRCEAGILCGVVRPDDGPLDFCMCNPPFFDVGEPRALHKPGHGGLSNELACPGGELAFIRAMLEDSKQIGEQIVWYSCMLGRKVHLKAFKKDLQAAPGVTTTRVCSWKHGRTTRWAVAWSYVRFTKRKRE